MSGVGAQSSRQVGRHSGVAGSARDGGGCALRRSEFPTTNVCQKRGLATSPRSCRTVVAMTNHAVVIAGAGPTGLMLAAELALAKVDVAIVVAIDDHHLLGGG